MLQYCRPMMGCTTGLTHAHDKTVTVILAAVSVRTQHEGLLW